MTTKEIHKLLTLSPRHALALLDAIPAAAATGVISIRTSDELMGLLAAAPRVAGDGPIWQDRPWPSTEMGGAKISKEMAARLRRDRGLVVPGDETITFNVDADTRTIDVDIDYGVRIDFDVGTHVLDCIAILVARAISTDTTWSATINTVVIMAAPTSTVQELYAQYKRTVSGDRMVDLARPSPAAHELEEENARLRAELQAAHDRLEELRQEALEYSL